MSQRIPGEQESPLGGAWGRGTVNSGAPNDRPLESSSDASAALAFAERISASCGQVLDEILASVVVHGSLALDDYTPGHSDVDLLGIVDRPLLDLEIASLTRVLAAEQAQAPGPVDLRVVTRAAAATPSEAPPMELYVRLDGSAPPDVESRHPEPDLVVEFSICLQHGRALLGAEPRAAISEVPDDWVLLAGDAQLARWQSLTDDAPHAALMVLTACRIWRFSEERTHCSKAAAGSWALARDPSLTAVRDALRQRAGDPVRIAPTEIGRLLKIVRTRIAPTRVAPA
jgi:predicted nucleotidyltransferase